MHNAGAEERPAVRVNGLQKKYGSLVALDGVSFEIPRGRILAYLGPNGAGKTTTIRILSGLLERDGGEVWILGRDVARDPVLVKALIGVVTENSNLYPELGCRRNLEYVGELYGLPRALRKRRARELLEEFALGEKAEAPFGSLSHGMKRRLTIAAGLVHRPPVLFLDEPTTGLDVPGARALRSSIRRIAEDGTAILLTTHNLFEADELAHDIAVLVKGRIVCHGSPGEVKRRVGGPRTLIVRFSSEVPRAALENCPAVRAANLDSGAWRIEVSDIHDALGQMLGLCRSENVRIEDLSASEPTLEDAFVALLDGIGSPARENAQ